MNSDKIPPVLLPGFLCLEKPRKPEERVDSVLDSLYLPPVAHQGLTEKAIGDRCEASLVLLHQLHHPGWTVLLDVPQALPHSSALLEEPEELNPPDMDDLSRERQDGPGLQRDPGEAAHQSIAVTGARSPTAPAEAAAAGTPHVVAAVQFLPGLSTAGTGPDLDLSLQAGVLPHHPAVVVEGVDVCAGGGLVVR